MAERFGPGLVRQAETLVAPAVERDRALVVRRLGEADGQGGLADPGLAPHQNDAALPFLGPFQRRPEFGELDFPSDEQPRTGQAGREGESRLNRRSPQQLEGRDRFGQTFQDQGPDAVRLDAGPAPTGDQ